jgi:two-component system response regulator RegA
MTQCTQPAPRSNGLDVISSIKQRRPEARAIILTGYGNIATAVNAVKLGAVDYLAKPIDAPNRQ